MGNDVRSRPQERKTAIAEVGMSILIDKIHEHLEKLAESSLEVVTLMETFLKSGKPEDLKRYLQKKDELKEECKEILKT